MGRKWQAATVVALASALTACGTAPFPSDQASAPHKIVVGAAGMLDSVHTTTAAKTARMSLDMDITGLPDGSDVEETSSGLIDMATKTFDLDMQITAVKQHASVHMLAVGDVLYMKLSGISGAPKDWMKVPASALGASSSVDIGPASDPTQFLNSLKDVADDVHVVGHDRLHGADTTHYEARLDLLKASSKSGSAKDTEDLGALFQELGSAMSAIPIEVWIDGDGRLRKMEMVIDFSALLGGLGAPQQQEGAPPIMTMTLELWDFGVPVHVSPPPAGQVVPYDPHALDGVGSATTA